MKKVYSVGIIIFFALLFVGYNIFILYNQPVKNVNKTIAAYDVLSFYDKGFCKEISKKLNIPLEDIYAVAYLSETEQKILFKDYELVDKANFERLLKAAKDKDFKLYNKKSNKYHTLSCKYGEKAQNKEIIPFKELPKGARPCDYCINKLPNRQKVYIPLIINVPNIKVIVSDYTVNLKPSRECKSDICKEIVNDISNAKSTIDIAIYGYDKVPAIEFALINAIKRGVKVRLLYDLDSNGNNIYSDTKYMAKLIKDSKNDFSSDFKYTNLLMHDKFYIFDSKKVITGSANMSYTDMSGFNSNSIIVISSPEIARIYEQEFNQMYEGNFHELKVSIPNKKNLLIGDSVVSIYFSPKDDTINNVILPLINSAKKYIYIPTFLITENKVTEALISAKHRGVDIKIIVDAVNAKSKYSKHQKLRDNGIFVKTENYAGKLHSKSIIIDDKYTLIGSMNFSKSGNSKNDENLVVIKNTRIAVFYRKFFEYLWDKISSFWLTHDVSAESIYSIGSCSDGIDNDFDGKIDSLDEGCMIKK